MHECNSFITLTYDNAHLPEDYSVSVREFQLFMKRLRKAISPTVVRFFACGEYGAQSLRPHYHALIFGYAFPDREFQSTTTQGDRLYTSAILQKVWPQGLHAIGDVTVQSAGYVAGYCMKKVNPDDSRYFWTHPVSGLVVQLKPEFGLQSRRPGIGSAWFDRFSSDAFPSDFLVIEGKYKRVPRYYLLKLREEEQQRVKRSRKRKSLPQRWNVTPERLAVREEIQVQRIKRLKRTL